MSWATGAWAADAWYGTAWYNSGVSPPVVVDIPASPGASDWLGRPKKKKYKVIRYADFASQEEYARELASASLPIARITPTEEDYEEAFGDDDAIIKALFLITKLH